MVWDLRDQTSLPSSLLEIFMSMPVMGPQHSHALINYHGVFRCLRNRLRPPCECPECVQQFRTEDQQMKKLFTYTTGLSDTEAQIKAAEITRSITVNLRYLQEQCSANGNSIMRRWKKKSRDKREALLVEVDPDMYPHQWCDIRITHDFEMIAVPKIRAGNSDLSNNPGLHRRPYRNACLLPYVNLEALKIDPATFLNLLYNRVSYSPEQWAPYDNFLLDRHWAIGGFDLAYNGGAIIMNGQDYGKWAHWEERGAHRWSIVGFPRAILILEAQQRLLEVLRGIVEKLVAGLNGESEDCQSVSQSDTFTKVLELGLKSNHTNNALEFASTYLNQPFSAPPTFSLSTLLTLCHTQLNLREDHLWLLQTDPSYIRRYAALLLNGGFGENLSKINKHVHTALNLMRDAVTFWSWEWILEEIHKLEAHSTLSNSPGQTIRAGYDEVLGSLEALLNDQMNRRRKHLAHVLPDRPGFSHLYKTEYIQRFQTTAVQRERLNKPVSLTEIFFKDRLGFCLSFLVQESPTEGLVYPNGVPPLEHAMLFAILQDHLIACSKEKDVDRLDEVLYSMYSDLSAIHQMLFMMKITEEGQWEDARVIPNKENGTLKIAAELRLANLLLDFMASPQPTSSRTSQTWLDKDVAQRAALGRFWEGMRGRHRQTLIRLDFGPEDITSDLQSLSADNDPKHISFARKAKKPSTHPMQTQWGIESPQKIETIEPQVKVKTRSSDSTEPSLITQANSAIQNLNLQDVHSAYQEDEQEQQDKASVSKRALSVFQSMYPRISSEERSKNVDWDVFVNAMADVGFVARHSAGGSAVLFEPNEVSKWAGKGKIVFHKPHPVPTIDAVMLSPMGKWMRIWFGWNEDTFKLEKK